MFLAMVLANARRQEARSVVLAVDGTRPRIEMLLADNSRQPLVAPPAEVLLGIMAKLEAGERRFSSQVFEANITGIDLQRGADGVKAHISAWSIEHCE
jgi:hypothetical protein